MLLMYVLPLYRTISRIVHEKESFLRHQMLIMGLSATSYWLSWFLTYFLTMTLISLLSVMLLMPVVFSHSSPFLLFLYFWTYGLSLFGFIYLTSTIFTSAKLASLCGCLIFFSTGFLDVLVSTKTTPESLKNLASLLFTTVAVSRGAENLAIYECSGLGFNLANFNQLYNNYRLSSCIMLMVLNMVLSIALGLAIEKYKK